jgi:hypothetical protein
MGASPRKGLRRTKLWHELAAATTLLGRNWNTHKDMDDATQGYPNIIVYTVEEDADKPAR